MILMIIGASALFSYTLSLLFVTQAIAEQIVSLEVNRWMMMTAPILLPIITGLGFDPYWVAIIFTVNMEIGLITPPVGLNLYVINSIAPDHP